MLVTFRHYLIQVAVTSGSVRQKQQEETLNDGKEKKPNQEKATTSKGQTAARHSQRSKKKPNWYGQNVMVQKVEEEEKERSDAEKSETKTEEDLRNGGNPKFFGNDPRRNPQVDKRTSRAILTERLSLGGSLA